MTTPEMSVAVITYNGERFVAEQIDSILEQTRPADEIVIVDDGSTDATLDIVHDALASTESRVTITQNERRLGARDNAARAMSLTTGTCVALADQDDRWHPDKLDRLHAALTDAKADAVFSDADLIDESGAALGRRLWDAVGFDESGRRAWRSGAALDLLLRGPVVTGATAMLHRSYLKRALPIPTAGWHDMWLALFGAATGARLEAYPHSLMDYRLHDNTAGIRPSTPIARLRRRSGGPDHREQQRQLDAELLVRLGESLSTDVRAKIEHHQRFLSYRDALPSNPVHRAIGVGRTWAAGDYRRFSRGWSTALADGLNGGVSRRRDREPRPTECDP